MKIYKKLIFISLFFLAIFSQVYAEKLDYRNLSDGEYNVNIEVRKDNDQEHSISMMNDAVDKPAKIVVQGGNYFLKFKMIPLTLNEYGATGYLGNISYLDSEDNEIEAKVLSYYDYQDELSQKYNLRYPKEIIYPIDKNKLQDVQETIVKVFVPIMEEIGGRNSGMGTQYARPTIYWNTLEKKDSTEYVNINISDIDLVKPRVRKIIDEVGKIVNYEGRKYLYINFFSKKEDSQGYDDGTKTLEYSYDNNSKRYLLNSRVIEEGKIGGYYQLSEGYIPINGVEEIYLYGKFESTKYNKNRTEQAAKINLSLLSPLKENSDELKLEFVKQDDVSVKKKKSNKLTYDFEKNGVLYSPYTSKSGDKFRLSQDGENVRFIFKKNSFMTNKLRNIKYTLDGSEPNIYSSEADLSFSNQNRFYSDSHYSLEIDPFKSPNISSRGGNVTLKIKAFDKDNNEISDTLTYIIPYDKETIREIRGNNIPYWDYPVSLNTGRKAALPKNASIFVNEISDYNIQNSLYYLSNQKGIKNPIFVECSLFEGNKALDLNYNGSWNANISPLAMVKIKGQGLSKYFAYEYKNGDLIPLATRATSKSLEFNISNNRGYYVIGEISKNATKNMAEATLINKIKEAEDYLSSGEINMYSLILDGDIQMAKNQLEKFKNTYNLLNSAEKIDRTLNLAKMSINENSEFYYEKAKVLINISDKLLNKNILSNQSYNEIRRLRQSLNIALGNGDIKALKTEIQKLDNILNNVSYKGNERVVGIEIQKEKSTQKSMASNVFENNAKLININGNYYLELGLKTMYFGNIRAHLLDLEVFENGINSSKLNTIPISKFTDTGLTGLEFYNKKLLVELGRNINREYYIRVKNDAMGNSRPVARMIINY